ncbi:alpha/beta fold hydrolase [Kribbella sandramycini]|uniref:Alpha/beta fold hydrolase n=1 Tax=Kribbella sandramycini TaxID=60450 RepID=A0A7Y4NYU8_9ACTN|nr:alpha/beta hydrolase [Kribbella sandramycini]MBB6565071.1 pimeloyl-ACP methyl ester carboxylesterase [Kribbella sandramycini]NOL41342.1 alpha/beta fold hydrolase [Kribbella sandramycini]
MSKPVAIAVTTLLTVGLLVSCGSSDQSAPESSPAPTTSPTAGASVAPAWKPCGVKVPKEVVAGLDERRAAAVRARECATIAVPVDYGRADGPTIQLAITRIRSADAGRRLGSVVYNPGGPGASGLDTVAGMATRYRDVLERYDLVSWDPRGAAASAPLTCGSSGDGADALPPGVPTTDAQWAALGAAAQQFGRQCAKSGGELLKHLGLFDSARDLDRVRAAVGDDKLHYVGVSYGGQLGAAYAELFPDRVGRMVLDGPGTPARTYEQTLLDQAAGAELGFQQLVASCLAKPPCALGRSLSDAKAKLGAFLTKLDAKPLPTRQAQQPLTRVGVVSAISTGITDPPLWPQLAQSLAAAYQGSGDGLLLFATAIGRRPDGSRSNLPTINSAVNCLDHPGAITVEKVRAAVPKFAQVSPLFGPVSALRLLECVGWPEAGVGRERPIDGEGAAPIVVVGNTGDPLGRYEWAQELATMLRSAKLLTWQGTGHGAYGQIDTCVDKAVNKYLLTDEPPAAQTCPAR